MPVVKRKDPKYRHYKPKNLAVVRVNGHDHYLGTYDSPKSWQAYWQLIAKWRAGEPLHPPSQQATGLGDFFGINNLVEVYLDHARLYYSNNGKPAKEFENMRYAVEPLCDLFGLANTHDFSPKSEICPRADDFTRIVTRCN